MDLEEFHEYYRNKYEVKHHDYRQFWRILLDLLIFFGLVILVLVAYAKWNQG